MARKLLAAFDFDHTVVEENTDIVVRQLLKNDKVLDDIKGMYTVNGWTAYMEKIFEFLRAESVEPDEIRDAIAAIPAVTGFPYLLERLRANNVETVIISDSNSVFIDHWLKSNNLSRAIAKVFTNPAWFDDDGLLKIEMYHLQDHCKLSSRNLCKGQILKSYVEERASEGAEFDRIAYVGDGRNDLCPVLRLCEKDYAFPRIDYPLMKILSTPETADDDRTPRAEIIPWKTGDDIWRELEVRIPNLEKKICDS